MGLSIHYKGKLKDASSLAALIEEVKDIAISKNWSYFIFDECFENDVFSKKINKENLYGISITLPKCEPLAFSFLSTGALYDIINFVDFEFNKKYKIGPDYYLSTKTQFAGYEVHKQFILLLAYISEKYLTDFECIDEGNYWDNRDEEALKETFEKYTNLIDSLASSLETIPMNEDETIEDYLIRISKTTIDRVEENDDDFPDLTLDQEIEFKKLKLSLEHDAVFPEHLNPIIPPELENAFLDDILNFEAQFENAKRITIFEKLGYPDFELAVFLTDEEIERELERVYELLELHDIALSTICEYEDENRLLYTFIIEELFYEEINDIKIPGMVSNFIYEDFHPNDAYDIENNCINFIQMFLNKKDNFYKKYHYKDAKNHAELNTFRKLFKNFKIINYTFETFTVLDKNAEATFSIEFEGKIKKTNKKVTFSGKGTMTLLHEFGYWYTNVLNLPINTIES